MRISIEAKYEFIFLEYFHEVNATTTWSKTRSSSIVDVAHNVVVHRSNVQISFQLLSIWTWLMSMHYAGTERSHTQIISWFWELINSLRNRKFNSRCVVHGKDKTRKYVFDCDLSVGKAHAHNTTTSTHWKYSNSNSNRNYAPIEDFFFLWNFAPDASRRVGQEKDEAKNCALPKFSGW